MARFEEISRTVEILTFDELVAFGKAQPGVTLTEAGIRHDGASITEAGLPMSFTYGWRPVRILRDDCYIVTTERGSIHVRKDHALVIGRDCEVYSIHSSKIAEHFRAV